jgi:eukaryotic-like serine/threonine-protein kinase
MADIYLAVARSTLGFNKLVVLKHLRSDDDDQRSIDMFLDEARLAARLSHPNIVDTYDVGQDGDSYFIAMEYLEGQSLSRLLKVADQDDVHPTAWARIAAEALRGLHYAHELCDYDGMPLHIVHRDVSPPNIFITYRGEVKIVDFGIAKATLNVFKTDQGLFKGKLGYMAPEQAAGKHLDRRADIFSMGVVLWEALTGQRLLEGGVVVVLDKLGDSDLPTVVSVRPDIDPRLSAIVERALARDPNQRYATAAEMADAIEGLLRILPDAVSKFEIGRTVMALFADHRTTVHRQIEKHLANADRQVLEGEFWSSSGILIASDGTARSTFPSPANEISAFDRSGSLPPPQASLSTAPHSMSDSEAPTDATQERSPSPWLAIAGGALAVAALGISLMSQRLADPSQGPASVESATAAAPSPPGPFENGVNAGQEIAAKDQPSVTTPMPTPTPTKRRFKSSRSSRNREPVDPSPIAIAGPAPEPAPAPVMAAAPVAPSPAAPPPAPAAAPAPAGQPAVVAAAPARPEPSPAPGTVDSKAVAAVVRSHAGEVRTCFDRARMEQPEIHGRLTVQAKVSPAGRVLSTSATNNVEGGARLQSCVVSAFQTWTFPAPSGGVNGNVTYSFVFE